MSADPTSFTFAENFTGQWLEARSPEAVKPDTKKFPEWGPEVKEAMSTETRIFFEAIVRENRPISDLLDGKYTFHDESLAKHCGISRVAGPISVELNYPRISAAEYLHRRSVLTVSSYPTVGAYL